MSKKQNVKNQKAPSRTCVREVLFPHDQVRNGEAHQLKLPTWDEALCSQRLRNFGFFGVH